MLRTRKRTNPTPSDQPRSVSDGGGRGAESRPHSRRIAPVRKPKPSGELALRPGESPRVVAHRGASGDYPELTLVAYENALAQGADGIECDIRMTLDGHLVCIHDSDTSRVSEEKRKVRLSTLEELKALDVGSWHLRHRKPEPPLALRELLELIRRPGRSSRPSTRSSPEGGSSGRWPRSSSTSGWTVRARTASLVR